ncbi:hypothetical protein Y1Q_0019244 [Alligator mississippiensis]|uniref:Uncharacterized protein n=1 Tax=Alligator mississippiensis TaxID=8496 RepID=A0A151MQU8_ALLMI|nr:hypothetical protein Y1Q_0019244 [Alligator mississippiensis]
MPGLSLAEGGIEPFALWSPPATLAGVLGRAGLGPQDSGNKFDLVTTGDSRHKIAGMEQLRHGQDVLRLKPHFRDSISVVLLPARWSTGQAEDSGTSIRELGLQKTSLMIRHVHCI